MKAVTEFAKFTLNEALKKKAALAAEGKTPEEIQQSLGEAFKLEGDKLGYFIAALDVAAENQDDLKRILVVSLQEGEKSPHKATKVEELYYVPEFFVTTKAPPAQKADGKGGRQGRGGGGRGGRGGDQKTKTSPWGLTPEEKAAKSGKNSAKPN